MTTLTLPMLREREDAPARAAKFTRAEIAPAGEDDTAAAAHPLKTAFHLACVSGPDVGLVVPIEACTLIGRADGHGLTSQHLSRTHAFLEEHGAVARSLTRRVRSDHVPRWPWLRRERAQLSITDCDSTNGTRVARRLPLVGMLPRRFSRQVGARALPLSVGHRIFAGGNVFEVRARPLNSSWPQPDPVRNRFVRWGIIPMLLFIPMMVWRLSMWGGAARGWLVGALGVAMALAAGIFALRFLRRRRFWRHYDAASLAVALSALPRGDSHSSSAPLSSPDKHSGSGDRTLPDALPVWPGMPGKSPALELNLSEIYGSSPAPVSLVSGPRRAPMRRGHSRRTGERARVHVVGFIGEHAVSGAYWWAAQIAARLGGARIINPDSHARRIGSPAIDIHIVRGSACVACADRGGSELRRAGDGRHVVHIGVGAGYADLPEWCDHIIRPNHVLVTDRWWDTCTESADEGTHNSVPDSVTWEDLAQWEPDESHSQCLRVPIGHDGHRLVSIDLVSDGPHALLAGTTGSGKSEALTTWLAQMCERFSPRQVQLVLIDYKGGATFTPLTRLPHTRQVLTDLEPDATSRAIRGLSSLLRERERDLARLGFPDIRRWHEAHCRGAAPEPPARIIIAIDEFRVLADSHPDTLDALVRLAAQGRSLGLHLIAATQRPSGAITPAMRSNIDIRIALRCATEADSLDAIGTPAAASLPRHPGRALINGGTHIQFAYCGDIERVVRRVRDRWGRENDCPPLWAPELPSPLSWHEVDATYLSQVAVRGCSGEADRRIAIGVADGIDIGRHYSVLFEDGHIRLEGPHYRSADLAQCAQALGVRIGQARGIPIHLCDSTSLAGHAMSTQLFASRLSLDDAGAVTHLLTGIAAHGPSVLIVTDVPDMMRSLDRVLSAGTAHTVWSECLSQARASGITIVAATPGEFGTGGSCSSTFSTRFVAVHSSDEALRAGLGVRTPLTRHDGHFILASLPSRIRSSCDGGIGEPVDLTGVLCALPHAIPTNAERDTHATSVTESAEPWTVLSLNAPLSMLRTRPDTALSTEGAELTEGDKAEGKARRADRTAPAGNGEPAAPCLGWVGASLESLSYPHGSCVLIGDDLEDARRILETHWHMVSGPRDCRPGFDPAQITLLGSHQWTQLRSHAHDTVIALDPSPDLVRALAQVARSVPVAVRAERWGAHNGIIMHAGRVERFRLNTALLQERSRPFDS